MDETTQLLALLAAAIVGLIAVMAILRRRDRDSNGGPRENTYAVSTEGMKRCPSCGFGNLVADATCASCGGRLPG
jgi:hypothetical protein